MVGRLHFQMDLAKRYRAVVHQGHKVIAAECSKALVLGTSLFGGVGLDPTAAKHFKAAWSRHRSRAPKISCSNIPLCLSSLNLRWNWERDMVYLHWSVKNAASQANCSFLPFVSLQMKATRAEKSSFGFVVQWITQWISHITTDQKIPGSWSSDAEQVPKACVSKEGDYKKLIVRHLELNRNLPSTKKVLGLLIWGIIFSRWKLEFGQVSWPGFRTWVVAATTWSTNHYTITAAVKNTQVLVCECLREIFFLPMFVPFLASHLLPLQQKESPLRTKHWNSPRIHLTNDETLINDKM